jgi:hypothetical protein
MKTWILDSLQYIRVDRDGNVHFKNSHGHTSRGITLTWRQFVNLNDIMRDLEYFETLRFISLGDQVWLQHYRNEIQIYHSHSANCFSFRKYNWEKYRRYIHRSIMTFIRREFIALLCKS